MSDEQERVLWAIPYGTPRTIAAVAHMAGLSRRDTEAAVEALRLAGEPIIGGSGGLRLTADPAELAAYVDARRRRLASIYRGCRSLRRTTRRMQERRDLTLFGDRVA
jgi:hypothetical protein